jgi:hypothetical protein
VAVEFDMVTRHFIPTEEEGALIDSADPIPLVHAEGLLKYLRTRKSIIDRGNYDWCATEEMRRQVRAEHAYAEPLLSGMIGVLDRYLRTLHLAEVMVVEKAEEITREEF